MDTLKLLEIRLFGKFRQFADNSSPSGNSILRLEEKSEETLSELIQRIGIQPEELGELFINSQVSNKDAIIPPNARIGIFPLGMHLLCGGQHLKGHGYITKRPTNSQKYW